LRPALPHRRAAGKRSELYGCLAELLSYPGPTLQCACANGGLQARLGELVRGLPYTISTGALAGCNQTTLLESEYLRLFELPVDGSTCPLYGGLHAGDRNQVMQELVRFYRHFGLSTANASTRDLPDSIPTVLEFLQYLASREADAQHDEEARSFRAAQRDLLERHLNQWTESIVNQLIPRKPLAFYETAVSLLRDFAAAELAEFHAESR